MAAWPAGRAGLLAHAALVAALTFAPPAAANAPAPLVMVPGNEGGAFVARHTSLVVEHEDLSFRCNGQDCAFQAVYHVLNPTPVREEVLGAFYGIKSEQLTATVDGADMRRTPSEEQMRAVDDAAAVYDPGLVRDDDVTRQGFYLAVDAHAHATLVFAGRMRSVVLDTRSDVFGEFAFPPLGIRHLWLSTTARRDTTDEYAYALSPIRDWAGSPTIDVTVRCPGARYWPEQPGWTVGELDGDFVARRTIAAADATTLRFRVVHPGTTLLNGGPMIGLGARLDTGEFRGRLGYEAALPWWVIWSAAVETSFKGTTTIAPLGEVATPNLIFLIPSFGLGAGVPVQLRSGAGARVGARMQLTVSFPLLSMVLPVDVFPGASSDVWQVGLYGQASF